MSLHPRERSRGSAILPVLVTLAALVALVAALIIAANVPTDTDRAYQQWDKGVGHPAAVTVMLGQAPSLNAPVAVPISIQNRNVNWVGCTWKCDNVHINHHPQVVAIGLHLSQRCYVVRTPYGLSTINVAAFAGTNNYTAQFRSDGLRLCLAGTPAHDPTQDLIAIWSDDPKAPKR